MSETDYVRGRALEIAEAIVKTISQTASVSVNIVVPAAGSNALEVLISPWIVQGMEEKHCETEK